MRLWPQYRLVVHLRDGVCKPLVHLQEGELFILRPLIRPGFGVHRPLPVIAGAAFQQRSPRFQRGTCTFRSCKQRLLVHYHTDPLNKTVVSTNMWVQPDAFFDPFCMPAWGIGNPRPPMSRSSVQVFVIVNERMIPLPSPLFAHDLGNRIRELDSIHPFMHSQQNTRKQTNKQAYIYIKKTEFTTHFSRQNKCINRCSWPPNWELHVLRLLFIFPFLVLWDKVKFR